MPWADEHFEHLARRRRPKGALQALCGRWKSNTKQWFTVETLRQHECSCPSCQAIMQPRLEGLDEESEKGDENVQGG